MASGGLQALAMGLRRHRPLGGAILAALAAAAAYGLRYGFVEPEIFGTICAEGAGAWWCGPRTALIVATEFNVLGASALLAAAIAVVARARLHAVSGHFACALSGAGLVLYNASFSSAALVLAILALAYRRGGAAQAAKLGG